MLRWLMFLVSEHDGVRGYSELDPERYYLCEWTERGRNHQRIYQHAPHGPYAACGSREAMLAAQRLLYPPAWEERQRWRQLYFELTGKQIFPTEPVTQNKETP